jgi:hypothetical protein
MSRDQSCHHPAFGEPPVKPSIYGYMRVADDMPDNDVEQTELVFRDYAERAGYCFVTTFCEYITGSQGAFVELIEELKRAEAHRVVVLGLDHLSAHPILRRHMVERLELEAQAVVIPLDGAR